jgi:two-component system NtrC family response regulator
MTIRIPALAERTGDALVLARAFLVRFAGEHGAPVKGFDQGAINAIERYSWPGNVRELESRVKRAVIMAEGSQVTSEDLELSDLADSEGVELPLNLRKVREAAEQQAIIRAMGYAGGNISEAATLLGITRPTLYSMWDKYGMK